MILTSEKKNFLKKAVFTGLILFFVLLVKAQKVDSIYFHLYTDSLKKGVHNYINVDGKLSNGQWMPLTSKEITFSSSHGVFEGNDLILPPDFKEKKLTVKAVLKSNNAISKEITIWIKKLPDPEKLPTQKEVMREGKRNRN